MTLDPGRPYLLGGLDRPSAGELHLAGQRIDQMTEKALAAIPARIGARRPAAEILQSEAP